MEESASHQAANGGLKEALCGMEGACPSCARNHRVTLREICVGPGVLEQVPSDLERTHPSARVAVVADEHTWEAAGEKLRRLVARESGSEVCACVIPRPPKGGDLIADERALGEAARGTRGADVLLAVGSGTIHDVVRRLAFETGRPFVSVPTAPSMDGFASQVASVIRCGVKVTLPGTPPEAIFADLDVVRAAPIGLIRAGLGDLLGKFVAVADWRLSAELNGEGYCDRLAQAELRIAREAASRAADIGRRVPQAVRLLIEGLILSGICILLHGTSRPASGAEHHISHYWEMRRLAEGRGHALHGLQVAVGCLLAARVYKTLEERLSREPDARRLPVDPRVRVERVRRAYGTLADALLAAVVAEPPRSADQLLQPACTDRGWAGAMSEVTKVLPAPGDIAASLRNAGAPVEPGDIGIAPGEVELALLGAKEMRQRYTILQLADELGWLEKVAAELGEGVEPLA